MDHKRHQFLKCAKESVAAQEEMLKIREETDRDEERFRQLTDGYSMVDAEMAAELQELKAGEERRGSNASGDDGGTVFRCVGADQARSKFDAVC